MRTLQLEKSDITLRENFQETEFRKDFGGNCKMTLTPLLSAHEIQMVTNWLFESVTESLPSYQKTVRPSMTPSPERSKRNFMIKMAPSIPVAKVQIIPVQEDVFSLHQNCEENHLIIRPVFNPKLQQNPLLYSNAIRMACLYSFTHLRALQVWMEVASYQKSFMNTLQDAGFQVQSEFFAQTYPITKLTMTLKEFKKREFFSI